LPVAAIRLAVEDATWPGRLDLRTWRGRPILVDGAHNPAGAAALVAYLGEAYGRPVPMVVAMLNDKDVDAMIVALAPAASAFVFTAPASSRVVPPAALAHRAAALTPDIPARTVARPADAIAQAAEFGEPVVVAGSLYLAGAVIADLA
jgi:dihydrofolate synthase/folylpolyglutamate synthase